MIARKGQWGLESWGEKCCDKTAGKGQLEQQISKDSWHSKSGRTVMTKDDRMGRT
jgi:hypothetical protein